MSIPSSVTVIKGYAFSGCSSLESVAIPNGVTEIDYCAFYGCSLESIAISASVSYISYQGWYAIGSITADSANVHYYVEDGVLFYSDREQLTQYPSGRTETTYSIPDGIVSIGASSFSLDGSLTSIVIPASVTEIQASSLDNGALEDIYYTGTEEQWSEISIGDVDAVYTATIHYNYTPPEPKPTVTARITYNGSSRVILRLCEMVNYLYSELEAVKAELNAGNGQNDNNGQAGGE